MSCAVRRRSFRFGGVSCAFHGVLFRGVLFRGVLFRGVLFRAALRGVYGEELCLEESGDDWV